MSEAASAGASAAVFDESELARWGRALGEAAARDGVFVALRGPLGAGKTRLAQAACAGAGVRGAVTSPTYTLVHWYEGARGAVAHADLYRIESESELAALGWEELEAGGSAVFVEWAERAGAELPPDRWEVRLSPTEDPGRRLVEVRACGSAPAMPPPARIGARGDGQLGGARGGAAVGGAVGGEAGGAVGGAAGGRVGRQC